MAGPTVSPQDSVEEGECYVLGEVCPFQSLVAYHFYFSTRGAQPLASEQPGVSLVPPSLREKRETEVGEEMLRHLGQQSSGEESDK